MPLTGDMSTNPDKSENFSITAVNNENTASLNAFVNGQRKEVNPMRPNAPAYNQAGLSLGVQNDAGSLGLSGVNIPNRANVVTASTNMHLVNNDNHKLTASALTTTVMPKAGPNYGTHGGGVDYSYKDTVGASASVAHTPMFKQTEYTVGGRMNLHQTPTSSLGLNVGATRTDSPFGRGNWQPAASFGFKKTF